MGGENHMDQIKIGKFIQERRKSKNITQSELANKLNITDRAVSKWERGLCLPDAGIMPELCEILGISINDLFSGEKVKMKNYEKKLEENLLEMTKIKEEKDKELLKLEIVIGYISTVAFLVLVFVASFVEMQNCLRIVLIMFGLITLIIGMHYAIRIEQIAGYYECPKCNYKYIPTYQSVFLAMHVGRTRYMTCPRCNKKGWHKKVISK